MSKYLLDDPELNNACVWSGGTYRLRRNFVGGAFRLRRASDNSEIDVPACGKSICETTINKHLVAGLVNLIGIQGSFEVSDLSYWSDPGSGGIVELSIERKHSGNKSIHFYLNNQGGARYIDISANNGDKLYCCAYANRISGSISNLVRLFDYGTVNNAVHVINASTLNVATPDTWIFGSNIKVAANAGTRLYLCSTGVSTYEGYIDDIIVLNLTQIYGAGNEPTQAYMDNLVQNGGTEDTVSGYVTTLRDVSLPKYVNIINLLGTDGDCESLTGWAKALNQGATLTTDKYTGNNAILLTGGSSASDAVYKDISGNIGDRFYCCCYTKKTSGIGSAIMYLSDYQNFTNPSVVNISTDNNYNFVSVIKTATTSGARIVLQCSNNMSQAFDTIVCINLSAFGIGGEPTKAQLDSMFQKALQEGYFINKNIIRPTDAITLAASNQPKWSSGIKFDGLDDYFVIPNYPEIDIVKPPMSIVLVFNPSNFNGYVFCKNLDASTNIQFGMYLVSATKTIEVYFKGVWRFSIPLIQSKDTVVIITWVNSVIYGYLNGVLAVTVPFAEQLNSAPNVSIGRRAPGVYYASTIHEILIFNKALSEREIQKTTKYFLGV